MTLENEILSIQDQMQKILLVLHQAQDSYEDKKDEIAAQLHRLSDDLTRVTQACYKLEAQNHDLKDRIASIDQRYGKLEEAMGSLIGKLIYEFD